VGGKVAAPYRNDCVWYLIFFLPLPCWPFKLEVPRGLMWQSNMSLLFRFCCLPFPVIVASARDKIFLD
jgi:hypothetical protein